ncbi:MAG: DNA processing protein [Planctomycetota bacterium]|jgi:DNA processing protein
MKDTYYIIALSFIPKIGPVMAKNLISYCGSAEAVFNQNKAQLIKIPGIGKTIAENIIKQKVFDKADAEMDFIKKYKIKAISFLDKRYPQRLSFCLDAPLVLYQKGNTDLNQQKIISIVGTRKATHYGKKFVADLLADLKGKPILVVSGMALGIDGQAHKSSVENLIDTVGVMGHGLNHFYPEQNKKTAKEMLKQNSSLITEFNSQEKFVPANFPKRNRIIAGMSDATIVVESEIKGGSLITANIANTYNRDVFAVPGRIKDKYSTGCNFLLKTYKANIIENASDLLKHMIWEDGDTNKISKIKQMELLLDLSPTEEKIVKLLQESDEVSSDFIMNVTKLTGSKVAATLLELELRGVVIGLPGNLYSLN